MKSETERPQTLREIELEVESEGREWTRQRLQQRLQAETTSFRRRADCVRVHVCQVTPSPSTGDQITLA